MSHHPGGGLQADLLVHRTASFTLDVSLSIPPGRTAALLGPNGAGKSTAVAALAGLIPLDRGRVVLDGRSLDDPGAGVFVPPEQRRVGVVFQDYMLFPHLSVGENIAFGPHSMGIDRHQARSQAVTWMRRLELADLAGEKPRRLSGGQAQRVALARALATEPDLLLLDEPLAALDVTTRARLRRTLADHLQQYRGPRLLITHDPVDAYLLADTVHVIENGAVTQTGTADEIRLRPRTPYAADLAGANLLVGDAEHGIVDVDGYQLHVADSDVTGSVLVTIHPRAIALHRRAPEGSPRNTWQTRVVRLELLGDRARVQMGAPVPLTAEVTREATDVLGVEEGAEVWVSIKATEIAVEPNTAPNGETLRRH